MKRLFSIALAVAAIGLAGQVLAKDIDMSKLTCKEIGAMPAARTVAVAMWVSGYAHGKAGNPMIDGEKVHANAEKAVAYCKKNPDTTLGEAMESMGK
ncbi:MAG TPA: HdeA/HdeB family chaperone [Mycoplana sp.]|jgi:acid stress chaperone HdeB|nr:HdeA/HdeB family chaperone [Mycoplana sp.]